MQTPKIAIFLNKIHHDVRMLSPHHIALLLLAIAASVPPLSPASALLLHIAMSTPLPNKRFPFLSEFGMDIDFGADFGIGTDFTTFDSGPPDPNASIDS